MNYVIDRRRPYCLQCGAELTDEPVDETGCSCDECQLSYELKARAEALLDFRSASRDWLKCYACDGTGMRLEGYCYCRKGNAAHEAEAARFAFVKSLPALAVTSARHMAENDIDPQERIAR